MLSMEITRVLLLTGISFAVGLLLTPLVTRALYRFKAGKQIRSREDAPIYFKLHKGKEGTPTMGGVIIWLTVLGLAACFFILNLMFDGFWSYLDIVDRAQTYLPIVAMIIAAGFGLFDDLLGVFLDDGVPDGAEAWVVVIGIAEVKANATGFTRDASTGSARWSTAAPGGGSGLNCC